jgi:putative transposase
MKITPVGATPSSRSKPQLENHSPHSKYLRKGCHSEPNQIYLITAVTRNRLPVFADFYKARQLIKVLKTEQHAQTLAFVVMPDHLHWLMALGERRQLNKLVQGIKSISSRKIGHPLWQAGYHDHALRAEEDLQATARYIVANPLRAGLVERIGDYPHWDATWL